MLFVGDHTSVPVGTDCVIYNLTSQLEGFERLDILPPNMIVSEENFREFDIQYAQYLLQYKLIEIMKVMFRLYDGYNVYILVYHDNNYYDMMLDSILKFIQQRYGIQPIIINEPEDYLNIIPTQNNSALSLHGLVNFDKDKEIYTKIMVQGMINYGKSDIPPGLFY